MEFAHQQIWITQRAQSIVYFHQANNPEALWRCSLTYATDVATAELKRGLEQKNLFPTLEQLLMCTDEELWLMEKNKIAKKYEQIKELLNQ